MARVALSIAGPAVGSFVFEREIPDGDAARILRAYSRIYGPLIEKDGDRVTGTRPRTPAEVLEALAQGFLDGVLHNVGEVERERAAADAAAGITPIEVRV